MNSARTLEDMMAAVKESMDNFAQAMQTSVTENYEQAIAANKARYETMSAQYYKAYDEMTALGRGCIDAAVVAGTIAAKGMEDLGKAWLAFARTSADQSVETAKAVATAKTVQEVVDLQRDYAKSTIDGFVAESSKLSEMSMKVANEAFAPLNAKVNEAVEILSRPLAA